MLYLDNEIRAGSGSAGYSLVRSGKARLGNYGWVRHGPVRFGKARVRELWHGKVRRGAVR